MIQDFKLFSVMFFVLLFGASPRNAAESSSVFLTLTSPDDVLSGRSVCPNISPVEFTCAALNVHFIKWKWDNMVITRTNLDIGVSAPIELQQSIFTLFLDTNVVNRSTNTANMISRLVVNITDVRSGERITCSEFPDVKDTRTLNYTLRSAPHTPSGFSVVNLSYGEASNTVNFTITFDKNFSSSNIINSYLITTSESSAAVCPSSCSPSGLCTCTGLVVGESVNITISAINCGNQEGPATTFQLDIEVPSKPPECSHVPVYNSQKELIMVEFYWAIADSPPIALGLNQSVVNYTISLDGIGTQEVSAITACPMAANNCSFYYPVPSLSLPSSPLTGGVAAKNIVGVGERCSPSSFIDTRNDLFSLILATTGNNATVQCSRSGAFDCKFCYGPGTSCQNLYTCVAVTIDTSAFLPTLTDITYCYRATASFSGTPISVIQDTFSTLCRPLVLGNYSNHKSLKCSPNSGSVSIPNGLACYTGTAAGSVATYNCDEGYTLSGDSQRTCQSDGNWNGSVPECELLVNSGTISVEVIGIIIGTVLLIILIVFITPLATVGYVKISILQCAKCKTDKELTSNPDYGTNIADITTEENVAYQQQQCSEPEYAVISELLPMEHVLEDN